MKVSTTKILLIISLLVAAALFFLLGCSSDPASPGDQTTPDTPTEELLLTETIGPDGGTIETENLKIEIPPGTISTDSEIALYELATESAFGDNSVSGSYKITGLPTSFDSPIRFAMKYSGTLANNSFIALGTTPPNYPSDDPTLSYALFAATDSTGYLVSEVSAPGTDDLVKNASGLAKGRALDSPISFLPLTKFKWQYITNFSINYPAVLEPRIAELGEIFQSALRIIHGDLGISFRPGTFGYMLTVVLQDTPVLINNFQDFLSFNVSWEAIFRQEIDVMTAGLGILDMEIFLAYSPSTITDYSLWFDVAIKTWAEELLTDDPAFVYPAQFPNNFMAPFQGMYAGYGENQSGLQAKKHGHGMSSVFKYLVDEKIGQTGIGQVLETMAENVQQTDALLQTVGEPPSDWWPDFFQQYVSGQIYDRTLSDFEQKVAAVWSIVGARDTLKVFASSDATVGLYPDLSAKMFMVNLEYDGLAEAQNLSLSLSTISGTVNQAMVVFGIQENQDTEQLEYLGTARNQDFLIPGLRNYFDTGMKKFLIVVVNSAILSNDYSGALGIDLTVEVTPRDESILESTTCKITLGVMGDMRTEFDDGRTEYETRAFSFVSRDVVGSFTGNTFNGSYDEDGNTESITVTLNDALDRVLFTSFIRTGSGVWLTLNAFAIPTNPTVFHGFAKTGTEVCEPGTQINYTYNQEDRTVTLEDFHCDGGSDHVTVSFGGP